jgi:hypothetical protein
MISELRKQYGLGDGGAASDSDRDCDGERGGGEGGAAELDDACPDPSPLPAQTTGAAAAPPPAAAPASAVGGEGDGLPPPDAAAAAFNESRNTISEPLQASTSATAAAATAATAEASTGDGGPLLASSPAGSATGGIELFSTRVPEAYKLKNATGFLKGQPVLQDGPLAVLLAMYKTEQNASCLIQAVMRSISVLCNDEDASNEMRVVVGDRDAAFREWGRYGNCLLSNKNEPPYLECHKFRTHLYGLMIQHVSEIKHLFPASPLESEADMDTALSKARALGFQGEPSDPATA